MRKSRSRERLLAVTAVTVSVCAFVVAAELALRLVAWYSDSRKGSRARGWQPPSEYSSTRHHRLIPNVRSRHKDFEFDYIWANNALGMRDRQRSAKKPIDSFRVYFLGDSVVQGWGVSQEQTMLALLESSLNRPEREKTIEVLNGGVFGYSPFLEYLFLKETISVIEPDLVLLGVFLGNDVGDDYFYLQQARLRESDGSLFFDNDDRWPWSELDDRVRRSRRRNGSVDHDNDASSSSMVKDSVSDLKRALRLILAKSKIVRLLKEAVQLHQQRQERWQWNESAKSLIEKHRDDIRINLGLVNYPVLGRVRRLAYWQISKQYLAAINVLCRERGVPLVLVVIPGEGEAGFDEPYEIIDQIGYNLAIPVIHLRSALAGPETSYPLDGHWNSEGNRQAALIVDRELRRLDILPALTSRRQELSQ